MDGDDDDDCDGEKDDLSALLDASTQLVRVCPSVTQFFNELIMGENGREYRMTRKIVYRQNGNIR